MGQRTLGVLLLAGAAAAVVAVMAVRLWTRSALPSRSGPEAVAVSSVQGKVPSLPSAPEAAVAALPESQLAVANPTEPAIATNKLQRLAQVREQFHGLAAGDPAAALFAAKQLTNVNERETALLTLVTEWTRGELSPPATRARAITLYGLEAGLGLELTSNPDLAVLWANQLTSGAGRTAILQQTAVSLVQSDPAAAFALSEQFPEAERQRFSDSLFTGWASLDTQAALDWAGQLPEAAQRDAALRAVRSAAPVGIGAAVAMRDGYPVIQDLIPNAPAQLSGQLQSGDRILAIAQGDHAFVDTRNMPLEQIVQMIRGAPGSVLQLQVLPADAAPGSSPRSLSIIRDQIKYRRPSSVQ